MTNSPIIIVSEVDKASPVFPSEYLDGYSPRDAINSRLIGYPSTNPLTISRNVEDCRGYVFQGSPFPGADLLVNANPALNGVPPATQLDGVILVPPESLVVGIACTSLQPEGFDYRIFDKSLQEDYFYGEFVSNYMLGNYTTLPGTISAAYTTVSTELDNRIVGQFLFQTPIEIVGSGELNCSVVNRSANYNICQFYLMFAVPGSYTNVAISAIDINDLENGIN